MGKSIRQILENTEFSDLIEKFETSGMSDIEDFDHHVLKGSTLDFLKHIEEDNDRRLRLNGLLKKEGKDKTKWFGKYIVFLIYLFGITFLVWMIWMLF